VLLADAREAVDDLAGAKAQPAEAVALDEMEDAGLARVVDLVQCVDQRPWCEAALQVGTPGWKV